MSPSSSPPALRPAAHTRCCAPRATQRVQPGGLLGGGGKGRWGVNPIKILLSLRACSGEAILDRRGAFFKYYKKVPPISSKIAKFLEASAVFGV